jgi:hypothetical protein
LARRFQSGCTKGLRRQRAFCCVGLGPALERPRPLRPLIRSPPRSSPDRKTSQADHGPFVNAASRARSATREGIVNRSGFALLHNTPGRARHAQSHCPPRATAARVGWQVGLGVTPTESASARAFRKSNASTASWFPSLFSRSFGSRANARRFLLTRLSAA